MGFESAIKGLATKGVFKKVPYANALLRKAINSDASEQPQTTAAPSMRYAPLDLSDTGQASLNLKKKKSLNPSLQAPMTLYDRQMLKGK